MRVLTTLLGVLGLASAQDANCDFYQDVKLGLWYGISSPNYPQSYPAGKQCRWIATCPAGYNLKLDCPDISLPKTTSCSGDRLLISPVGDSQLAGADVYCGTGYASVKSQGQRMSVGLVSPYSSTGGRFFCNLTTVASTTNPTCSCGYRKTNRIVGGQETGVNEYTPMAGLVDARINQIKCGAVIISAWYVLTAAHCLANLNLTLTGVLVGEHDITTGADSPYTRLIKADRFIVHPQFDSNNYDYDAAIVRVSAAIAFSDRVGPVCLPFKFTAESFADKTVTVLGWGTKFIGGPTSNYLQKADLQVISQSSCRSRVSYLTDRMMCTYTPGKDACQDDSGGPIMYTDPQTGRLVIVAIVSFGISCASNSPGIHTRVTQILQWIRASTPDTNYCII